MSKPSPYTMTIGEDGLSVRCEWDAHYLTDEQLETVRKHVETLQAENAKLRELVRDMWHDGMCECDERGACAECEYNYTDRMRELGVEL